jgi:chemotaxis protein MotA
MDIASLIGVILVFVLIIGSILVGGGSFGAFIDIPSVLVVIGGCIASVLVCFPLKSFLSMPGVIKIVFLNKPRSVPALIEQLVSLAETARRDGLLALEGRLDEVDNSNGRRRHAAGGD